MKIGERLRDERVRLGFNQSEFAAFAGVAKTSQFNYEKGDRSPDAAYLAAVAEKGVDILYVVTGQRSPTAEGALSASELEIVQQVRSLEEEDLGALKRLLMAFSKKN
ncbi:TPA: helix-turn-helix transcriptional regulator [Pseudomonas aeruginosa]|uniref:helix-turn-helix domain-containing protein n=1 Tax=unclassified Pseudomonas TaxID=196821 RepID=UPI00244A1F31|nr:MULTISPECIES: helix-turn-helix transcriptional regulator [unclassified Pseudomonas]MDH0301254.1 helix-turn-helix domain-containing protein [Pseudomonas sp. GD04091]MDH1984676.1 helix-turn-helix domain-containing protein [Pseudomonas sp. GD03689]HCF0970782.1 helix-turn-helix transcriptional regulator [Pseudomonas aeruginosa]